jgi:hypothetical protein
LHELKGVLFVMTTAQPESTGQSVGPGLEGLSLKEAIALGKYMKEQYGIETAEMVSGLRGVSASTETAARGGLDVEIASFERDLRALVERAPGQFAVYCGERLVGVYAEYAAALDAGFAATQCRGPFLARRIAVESEESSSWEAGRPAEL